MWLPRRGCRRHHIYLFLSFPNNHYPCVLLLHSCCITRWIGDLLQSYFRLFFRFCFCFLNSLTLYGHTCHNCCICPWRTCYSFFHLFIRSSTLEHSLLVHIFPLFFFRSALSSITKVSLSSNIWIPYLQYWHWKILLLACIIQVRCQRYLL